MGLIKAAIGAAGGTLADQWKEFFYSDSLDNDTLMVRGKKRTDRRSSNTKGHDNVITNGSGIAVADGQCMMIVDQGKIVEVCAEPGEYTYDMSSEPSVFCGSLGEGIKATFQTIGKRFTFGGDTAKDQRVYYFNTKEITDNKFGTANPVWFRVVDKRINLDKDIEIRCNGIYSFRITDPLLFYTSLGGNVTDCYEKDQIAPQLKTEFVNALQPAFARISEQGIRYSALPGHTQELSDALNQVLTEKWNNLRGICIVSLGVSSVKASEEDEAMIKELQRNAAFRNPTMAAAHMVGAQASAMQAAASNQNAGPVMAFAGMNMASNAGGVNAQNLFAMGQQAQPQMQPQSQSQQSSGWTCACGAVNTGKFCSECGQPRPAGPWTCSCGAANTGKFCSECGRPRP